MQTDPWKVTPSLVPWFAIWITIYCLGFSPMDHLMLFPLNLSYYYAAYLVLPLQFFCISKLYSWMMHGDVLNFLPECQPGSPELLRNCSFIWLLTSQNPDNWTPRIWSQYIMMTECGLWPKNSLLVFLSSYFILGTVGNIKERHWNLGDFAGSWPLIVSFRWHIYSLSWRLSGKLTVLILRSCENPAGCTELLLPLSQLFLVENRRVCC